MFQIFQQIILHFHFIIGDTQIYIMYVLLDIILKNYKYLLIYKEYIKVKKKNQL